ncbi:MAG: hypothetical protein GWO24_01545, partial [Akkermansiaceae bacterium]|nr:hypothetical protein [Akkermansiaceae bacterium]NIS10976.1 hypothetical protein [Thermoplasmata archaeon]NIS18920.1 hypothetical protein [Thermoplasmata archaeon]NIT75951.1 hypothetical protein [Thermoplasmata archaeon]NIY02322.1 hypothetical protein [Thermoplasmata archaeon]
MRESDETAGAQDERTPDEGPKTDPTKTEGEKEAEDGPGDTTADIGSRLWALGWLTKAKKALGPTAWFQFLDWGRIEIGYEDQGARFAYTGSGADPGFLIDKLLLDRRARRGDPQVA